ncbi:PCC domain-containing protein [Pelagibius marinus]|uniref:PCC domain-containing protein n=1 Tax=Pelagibius marinus TaxID=2762760 RepID=UPI001872DFBA|nr:PPC domain-containing DNA-binding protein [Pelagibius marinus]
MSEAATFEEGKLGRIAVVRLRPNEDLVGAVEAACGEHGLSHAVVRSAVGSLVDAVLEAGDRVIQVPGPGIEILTLAGEVRPDAGGRPRAELRGTIADGKAQVYGGRFRRGANPICITLELVLQEWLPA